MQKILQELISKKFTVLINNGFERTTNFLGFMKLLTQYSDFFQYTPAEQKSYLSKLVKYGVQAIDVDISVKINKNKNV